jgi:predicted secreted acid phosphatase
MSLISRITRLPRAVLAVAVVLVAAVLVGSGIAYGAGGQPSIKTSTPRFADQITNNDILHQQIRNYYGDPLGTGTFADSSNYANETRSIAASAQTYLARVVHDTPTSHPVKPKAIVLDVDDTTLATWNYEVASNWTYNPMTNADYVNGGKFPAVPGMVGVVDWAAAHGVAVFFLTGRPQTQEPATLANLTASSYGAAEDYPAPTTLNDGEDGLFTKPAATSYPAYLTSACAADPNGACTTIHYKSATRAHIESLGYDIVANFGDQFSDLTGGAADRTFKLPNPNYYLP